MSDIRITLVRYSEEESLARLRRFVFGGYQAGRSAPRGVAGELVSEFITDEIRPDSPAGAYAKVVDLLRFYERSDCLEGIGKALAGRERSSDDVMRSAFAIQAIGEVGQREAVDEAAAYFDAKLVPHQRVFDSARVLIDTLVVLSPSGSPDKLSGRIAEEVRQRKLREKESEESMSAYDRIAAVQRLQMPVALRLIQAKKDLLAMGLEERRMQLVRLYLGLSPNSTDLMMTWAGRMLRREAIEGDAAPIHAALAEAMAKVDPEKVGKDPDADTMVSRCARAIVYLGGMLSGPQRRLYKAVELGGESFLWDDLPELPPEPPEAQEE